MINLKGNWLLKKNYEVVEVVSFEVGLKYVMMEFVDYIENNDFSVDVGLDGKVVYFSSGDCDIDLEYIGERNM